MVSVILEPLNHQKHTWDDKKPSKQHHVLPSQSKNMGKLWNDVYSLGI